MRITGAQVFDLQEGCVPRDICFDGRLLSGSSADGKTYDASGCYVIPGLTDVHFHGCMGRDFSDAEPEGLEIMAQYELSRGVTQICPAGMTLTEEQLTKICQVAAAHRAADKPGAALCGINLEGPFLSMAKKGAQNGAWLHAPDVAMFRRLMAASQGLVKLVSIAPEEPGAMEFIEAVEGEVTVSISDTGIGMDEETQRHIFDKFYRAAPYPDDRGNGLGLSIVRRVVKLCGGQVAVFSRPGNGSTFTVTLPAARE